LALADVLNLTVNCTIDLAVAVIGVSFLALLATTSSLFLSFPLLFNLALAFRKCVFCF
jgi:hypothetical protein